MKTLLYVTAIIEGCTAIALIAAPALFVSLLLGTTLSEQSGMLVSRLAGASLASLAIICWLYRNKAQTAAGIIKAMLFYNLAAAALLIYAFYGEGYSGVGLWPAVLLHASLAVWCLKFLQKSGKH